MCCHSLVLGELSASCVILLGEDLESLLLVSLDFTFAEVLRLYILSLCILSL